MSAYTDAFQTGLKFLRQQPYSEGPPEDQWRDGMVAANIAHLTDTESVATYYVAEGAQVRSVSDDGTRRLMLASIGIKNAGRQRTYNFCECDTVIFVDGKIREQVVRLDDTQVRDVADELAGLFSRYRAIP